MSEIYLQKDEFVLETDKWIEQSLFIVQNKVVYDDDKQDIIEIPVLAQGIYEAWDLAKDFLLSRKAYRVKAVVGQQANGSKHFLIQKVNK